MDASDDGGDAEVGAVAGFSAIVSEGCLGDSTGFSAGAVCTDSSLFLSGGEKNISTTEKARTNKKTMPNNIKRPLFRDIKSAFLAGSDGLPVFVTAGSCDGDGDALITIGSSDFALPWVFGIDAPLVNSVGLYQSKF